MNFRFVCWPIFGSNIEPESHQHRSNMHSEISFFLDTFLIWFRSFVATFVYNVRCSLKLCLSLHETCKYADSIATANEFARSVDRELYVFFLQKCNEFLYPFSILLQQLKKHQNNTRSWIQNGPNTMSRSVPDSSQETCSKMVPFSTANGVNAATNFCPKTGKWSRPKWGGGLRHQ